MPANDTFLGQVFPGEFCQIYIGSKNQTPVKYSAYITDYNKTGLEYQYATERSMGTHMIDRQGISDGDVSFSLIIVGSSNNPGYGSIFLQDLTYLTGSQNGPGYRQYVLDYSSNKLFKIKIEFQESASGSPGSAIAQADNAYKQVFYNARSVTLTSEVSAEDYLKGALSFKISPFTELGSSNYRELVKGAAINLTLWGSIESDWDTENGW